MSPVLSLTFCKSLLDMSRCWMGSSFKILLLQIPPLFLNFLSKIARILIECQHLYPHHHPPAHLHLLLPCLQPPTHPPLPMPLIWLTFFFHVSFKVSPHPHQPCCHWFVQLWNFWNLILDCASSSIHSQTLSPPKYTIIIIITIIIVITASHSVTVWDTV